MVVQYTSQFHLELFFPALKIFFILTVPSLMIFSLDYYNETFSCYRIHSQYGYVTLNKKRERGKNPKLNWLEKIAFILMLALFHSMKDNDNMCKIPK